MGPHLGPEQKNWLQRVCGCLRFVSFSEVRADLERLWAVDRKAG